VKLHHATYANNASHVLTIDYTPNQEATSLLQFTDKAFAISVPTAWHSLTTDICDGRTEARFKKHLKTFLFNVALNKCHYSIILSF